MGRASKTKDATPDILARIMEGCSLRGACQEYGLSHSTFLGMCAEDPDLANQYARAREIGLELLADQIIGIADTPVLGTVRTVKDGGVVEVKESDMLGHRELQVNSRKWILSKLLPKKYGDSSRLELGGSLEVKAISQLPTDELERIVAEKMQKLGVSARALPQENDDGDAA